MGGVGDGRHRSSFHQGLVPLDVLQLDLVWVDRSPAQRLRLACSWVLACLCRLAREHSTSRVCFRWLNAVRGDLAIVEHEDLGLPDRQNSCRIRRASCEASKELCRLLVFPELSVEKLEVFSRLHEELPSLATEVDTLDICR